MRNAVFIALIVVAIIILGLGFYFFTFQRLAVTAPQTAPPIATPQPRPTNINAITPQTVAQGFFIAYVGCLLNPPPRAAGNISPYCQTSTGYTVENFAQNIAAGGVLQTGNDPITCASSVPQGTTFQTQSATADTALVIATEGFGGGPTINVQISLVKENDTWKVANVICSA